MSLAITCARSALAAAIASTPVPVPMSRIGPLPLAGELPDGAAPWGREGQAAAALEPRIQRQQAAARGAVMAGAERERRLDLDADAVRRHPGAVMRAVHQEAPGRDRLEPGEARRHPVARRHRLEHEPPAPPPSPAIVPTSARNAASSGGAPKCASKLQPPSGRSNAATAASPASNVSASASASRRAVARSQARRATTVTDDSGDDGICPCGFHSLSTRTATVVVTAGCLGAPWIAHCVDRAEEISRRHPDRPSTAVVHRTRRRVGRPADGSCSPRIPRFSPGLSTELSDRVIPAIAAGSPQATSDKSPSFMPSRNAHNGALSRGRGRASTWDIR